jgi:DNA-binding response OmpR family regulator
MRVMVVEDQRLLADAVAEGLRQASLAVDVAYDGGSALERLRVNSYDVVVLDRDLPTVSGDAVCAEIVAAGTGVRVLMLTAAGSVDDRVHGLNLGADDYLAKPFDMEELLARVRALGRRSGPARAPILNRAGVQLDPHRREVRYGGRLVSLSRKEFTVLEELLRAEGGAVSSEELLERAWDEHADPFTNVIRVTVLNLRKKLGDPPVISTVHGVGYRIP